MPNNQNKKKWSKSKTKEKINNKVLIDKEEYEKILKEIYKTKVMTPSNLSERFHISCSLSKKILSDLFEKNVIKLNNNLNKQLVYLKVIN
ncbi:40S ribosomal protein S25 (nucleomorph) [Chroomonas mesostigmatica CCMP1168]|uniref:40S ribosomal protein S25 n=1 Tax=Chroomonas mesostigmatica CCMP1168 TaxID=1195612 RepID=J7G3H5_9CRYP|nr:40S ribosomal protein S25 [Chroomonas mesostigmatica CCMP1168]